MEDQKKPETENLEKPLPFVERLKLREIVHSPIRGWLAWAGILFLAGLIAAYYLTTGR